MQINITDTMCNTMVLLCLYNICFFDKTTIVVTQEEHAVYNAGKLFIPVHKLQEQN